MVLLRIDYHTRVTGPSSAPRALSVQFVAVNVLMGWHHVRLVTEKVRAVEVSVVRIPVQSFVIRIQGLQVEVLLNVLAVTAGAAGRGTERPLLGHRDRMVGLLFGVVVEEVLVAVMLKW